MGQTDTQKEVCRDVGRECPLEGRKGGESWEERGLVAGNGVKLGTGSGGCPVTREAEG